MQGNTAPYPDRSLSSAEALSETLLRDARRVRNLARALVGAQDADDLVQDAWVRALESSGPSTSASPGAWMRAIVANLARDGRRRTASRRAREHDAARPEALPSSVDTSQRVELFEKLARAVRSLDEPYRSTIWLRYFEGLSVKAIGKQHDCGPRTVETRLRRGLEILKRKLDGMHGGERAQWFGVAAVIAGTGAASRVALAPLLVASVTVVGAAVGTWAYLRAPEPTRVESALPVPLEIAQPADAGGTPSGRVAQRESQLDGRVVVRVVTSDGAPLAHAPLRFPGENEVRPTGDDGALAVDWDDAWKDRRVDVLATATTCRSSATLREPGVVRVVVAMRTGTVRGTVIDVLGNPPATAQVLAWRDEKPRDVDLEQPDLVFEVESDGTFELTGLAGEDARRFGEFTLTAIGEDRLSCLRASGRVKPGETLSGVVLALLPSRSIDGRVFDPRARPLEGVLVSTKARGRLGEALLESFDELRFQPESRDLTEYEGLPRSLLARFTELRLAAPSRDRKRVEYDARVRFDATSGVDGRFELRALLGDEAAVTARHLRFPARTETLDAFTNQLDIYFGDGATVSGVVRDASGRPVVRAAVQVVTLDGKPAVLTDEQGEWGVEGVALQRGAIVTCTKDGFAAGVIELRPIASDRVRCDHVLNPAKRITGVVRSSTPGGTPILLHFRDERPLVVPVATAMSTPRKRISSTAFAPPYAGRVMTDADGRFELDGLEDRTYQLWVEDDERRVSHFARVDAGMEDVVITPTPRGTGRASLVRPHVIGEEDDESVHAFRLTPLTFGPLAVGEGDGWTRGITETGTYRDTLELDGLEPGAYELEVRRRAVSETYRIELATGQNRPRLERSESAK